MDTIDKLKIGKIVKASLYSNKKDSWWEWLKKNGFTSQHIEIGKDDVN